MIESDLLALIDRNIAPVRRVTKEAILIGEPELSNEEIRMVVRHGRLLRELTDPETMWPDYLDELKVMGTIDLSDLEVRINAYIKACERIAYRDDNLTNVGSHIKEQIFIAITTLGVMLKENGNISFEAPVTELIGEDDRIPKDVEVKIVCPAEAMGRQWYSAARVVITRPLP